MRADWEREAIAAVEEATRERIVTHEQMVTIVGDTLEPLVRADERATIKYEMGVLQWEGLRLRQERADLRARVEALPTPRMTDDAFRMDERWDLWRARVIALFDGGSDD